MTIQRLEFWVEDDGDRDPWAVPHDDTDGDYVRYSDHLAAMQRERECRTQLVAALSRCEALVHLLTVRQVVSEGGKALEASGLNPWCLNEGLATGDERLSTWWIDAALLAAKELG